MEEQKFNPFIQDKGYLKFEVIDTGIGMNEESLKNIFKVFCKLKEGEQYNKYGLGLGLSICKKICESMGGGIDVESEIGLGTKFTFYVKL